MQERRTYIPQGWTKFYEFSYGDLRAGTFVMEAMSHFTGDHYVTGCFSISKYFNKFHHAFFDLLLSSLLNATLILDC